VAFRCGYCPALSVREGPAHSRSCPRYKPPAPRRRGHKWVWAKNLPTNPPVPFGELQPTKDGWLCKKCGSKLFDCTKPYPRHPPLCDDAIVERIMES